MSMPASDLVPENVTLGLTREAPGRYYVRVIADNFSKVSNQSSISNDETHSVELAS
jgi:hypothetical protein